MVDKGVNKNSLTARYLLGFICLTIALIKWKKMLEAKSPTKAFQPSSPLLVVQHGNRNENSKELIVRYHGLNSSAAAFARETFKNDLHINCLLKFLLTAIPNCSKFLCNMLTRGLSGLQNIFFFQKASFNDLASAENETTFSLELKVNSDQRENAALISLSLSIRLGWF